MSIAPMSWPESQSSALHLQALISYRILQNSSSPLRHFVINLASIQGGGNREFP